ncbi:hypothetical protein Droror1_Dr00008349 [Drosera rotundifolia]
MEARNQQLSSKIENIKKENKSLSEVNISSTLSIKIMQFLCSPMDMDVEKVVPLQFPDKGKAKMDEVGIAQSVNDEHVVEEVEKSAKEEEPEEEDLRKAFEKVGDVVEVRLLKDPVTIKNRGFAFVRFAAMDAKERVILGETIMKLLLKMDTIQGLHWSLRDMRKSVAKGLVGLQEELGCNEPHVVKDVPMVVNEEFVVELMKEQSTVVWGSEVPTAQVGDDGDDQVNVAEQESPSVTDALAMGVEEENQMQEFCDEAETLKNSDAMRSEMESTVDEEVEASGFSINQVLDISEATKEVIQPPITGSLKLLLI